MKKKISQHPLWMPVIITVLSTVVVFVLAEYAFHIPSRFFVTEETEIIDDDSWTPRSPMVVPPPVVVESGSLEDNKPVACTMEYAPVCGADDHDYSNACMAEAGGTTVAYTGNCKKEIEVLQNTGSNIEPQVSTGSEERDLSLYETGLYQIYENKSFEYAFALPKFAYYQGYGKGSNSYGADHVLAVSLTSTGVDSLDTADVRIMLFRKSPESPVDGTAITLSNGSIVYVASSGTSPKIQKIVDTVVESVQ